MKQVWSVDDEEEMTRAIELMLKLLDCEVLSFLNARSTAQTLLTGKCPDLIILDINMPEVTGLGFGFLSKDQVIMSPSPRGCVIMEGNVIPNEREESYLVDFAIYIRFLGFPRNDSN